MNSDSSRKDRKISRSLRLSSFSRPIGKTAGELLGDGAAARRVAPLDGGEDDQPHHPREVDAAVVEEAVVLGVDEGLDDAVGNLLELDRDAALVADLRQQLAVAAVHAQRQLHAGVAQLLHVRQPRCQVVVGADAEEQDERDAAGDEAGGPGEQADVDGLHGIATGGLRRG